MTEVVINGVTGTLEEKLYKEGTYFAVRNRFYILGICAGDGPCGRPAIISLESGNRYHDSKVVWNSSGYTPEEVTEMFYGETGWVEVKKITISAEV